MGDRYFDLANFAVNNELGEAEEEALLDAYFGEAADAGRLAALRLMRFMSDFREAMWGVVQGALSDLDFDFADYAAEHFEPDAGDRRRPRFETWLEEAAWRRGLSFRTGPLRDHRRRGRRRLDRLPPGQARLGRRRPARARAAHLGLDLPLRRPRRPAARLGLADEDDDALGRALPAADGRVRVRPRLGRVRRHPARLERGAARGAAPPGGLGEDVRPAAGADLGRRGEGDVPADVDRRRARRRLAAHRRLHRPVPAHLRARRRRPPRAAAGVQNDPGDRDRGRPRPGARGGDRARRDRGRGRGQRRRDVRRRDRPHGRRPGAGDPDVAPVPGHAAVPRARRAAACRPCATPTC